MAIGMLDSAVFADMFGTPEMRRVFGDEAFLARCIEVEAALARAQARLGLIPAEAAAAISKAADRSAGTANQAPESPSARGASRHRRPTIDSTGRG